MFARMLNADGKTYNYFILYYDPQSPYDNKYFYQNFRNPTQTRLELGWNAWHKGSKELMDARELWFFVNEIEPYLRRKGE